MYKLSICIPTRNRPQDLLKTVKEVQSQISVLGAQHDIEIIVADNTDQQDMFVDADIFIADNVRYVINEGNLGYARNINKLILLADGEYVWLLSDDDMVLPNAVMEIYDVLGAQGDKSINYLTFFSGVKNEKDTDENFYFKECQKFYYEDGNDFLVKYWLSVIFVSVNIFHRQNLISFAKSKGLFENINDVFQNSLMNIGFISQCGGVRIIPKTLLFDSYANKLYTPFHSVNVPILNYVKLLCQLRAQGVPRRLLYIIKKDMDMSILFNGLRFLVRLIETEDDFDYAGHYMRLLAYRYLYFSSKAKAVVIIFLLKCPRMISKFLIKSFLVVVGKAEKYEEFKSEGRKWYGRLQSETTRVSY